MCLWLFVAMCTTGRSIGRRCNSAGRGEVKRLCEQKFVTEYGNVQMVAASTFHGVVSLKLGNYLNSGDDNIIGSGGSYNSEAFSFYFIPTDDGASRSYRINVEIHQDPSMMDTSSMKVSGLSDRIDKRTPSKIFWGSLMRKIKSFCPVMHVKYEDISLGEGFGEWVDEKSLLKLFTDGCLIHPKFLENDDARKLGRISYWAKS
eukprot:GHVS01055922.1.p1 GENE.GHVS01055922.1~~GHVS01055922.1.p1  ORF type:complete len:203 (-),score=2.80 GHVS01055922.1:154-762(-)